MSELIGRPERSPLARVSRALAPVMCGIVLLGCGVERTDADEYNDMLKCVAPKINFMRHGELTVTYDQADEALTEASQACWQDVSPQHLDYPRTRTRLDDSFGAFISAMVSKSDSPS